MTGGDLLELRFDIVTVLEEHLAACRKLAADGKFVNIRDITRNGRKPVDLFSIQLGQGCQKTLGVGMPRVSKQIFHRCHFLESTAVHDRPPVTGLGHNGQVVSDQ